MHPMNYDCITRKIVAQPEYLIAPVSPSTGTVPNENGCKPRVKKYFDQRQALKNFKCIVKQHQKFPYTHLQPVIKILKKTKGGKLLIDFHCIFITIF